MKSVSEEEWKEKAAGLAEWRKNRTSPPNMVLYKKIVSMVHVGRSVLDVGCGQCHLERCMPNSYYVGVDPFPLSDNVVKCSAEGLPKDDYRFDSVFMLSALDNVKDLKKSLIGLKSAAMENIVILTGIGIPPDQNHTVQVDREDLVSILGEPFQEVEMLPKVWLFEWRL